MNKRVELRLHSNYRCIKLSIVAQMYAELSQHSYSNIYLKIKRSCPTQQKQGKISMFSEWRLLIKVSIDFDGEQQERVLDGEQQGRVLDG